MVTIYVTLVSLSDYIVSTNSDTMVRATKPRVVSPKSNILPGRRKMDFCKTRTCNLQLSTLMLCHLSQEAHPASTATSCHP